MDRPIKSQVGTTRFFFYFFLLFKRLDTSKKREGKRLKRERHGDVYGSKWSKTFEGSIITQGVALGTADDMSKCEARAQASQGGKRENDRSSVTGRDANVDRYIDGEVVVAVPGCA